jgi:hypothetical protein
MGSIGRNTIISSIISNVSPSVLGQVVLPRPQPRVPADRLQRHLEEALKAEHQLQD